MRTIGEHCIEITQTTKGKLPRLPFVLLKEKILGKKYDLSVAFISLSQMKKLSKEFKGNFDHTNILSFPFDKNNGEIIMNLETIKREAKKFEHTYEEHLLFLTIHGMLHLKGHIHGHTMEKLEAQLFEKYNK